MGNYRCFSMLGQRRPPDSPAPNQRRQPSWLKRLLSRLCRPAEGISIDDGSELTDIRTIPIPSANQLDGEERAWHYIVRYVWQSNFNAPVQNQLQTGGAHVLDVCCETGEWTLDLALNHGRSNFVGIDATLRPEWENKPDNVAFLDVNPEYLLPFGDEAFDFVHIRCHTIDYARASWERVILPSLVRVLKPDGFLEICVTDLTLSGANGTMTERIMNEYQAYKHARNNRNTNGTPPTRPQDLERMLQEQPMLTDITRNRKEMQLGQWGAAIGEAHAKYWIDRWRGTPELASIMAISKDRYQSQLSTVVPAELARHQVWLLNARLTARKIARTTNDTR